MQPDKSLVTFFFCKFFASSYLTSFMLMFFSVLTFEFKEKWVLRRETWQFSSTCWGGLSMPFCSICGAGRMMMENWIIGGLAIEFCKQQLRLYSDCRRGIPTIVPSVLDNRVTCIDFLSHIILKSNGLFDRISKAHSRKAFLVRSSPLFPFDRDESDCLWGVHENVNRMLTRKRTAVTHFRNNANTTGVNLQIANESEVPSDGMSTEYQHPSESRVNLEEQISALPQMWS